MVSPNSDQNGFVVRAPSSERSPYSSHSGSHSSDLDSMLGVWEDIAKHKVNKEVRSPRKISSTR